MWYFENLGAYKSAAHGSMAGIKSGHDKMAASLDRIETKAKELRNLFEAEQKGEIAPAPSELWMKGAYTDYNRDHN